MNMYLDDLVHVRRNVLVCRLSMQRPVASFAGCRYSAARGRPHRDTLDAARHMSPKALGECGQWYDRVSYYSNKAYWLCAVSYTHLRAHET